MTAFALFGVALVALVADLAAFVLTAAVTGDETLAAVVGGAVLIGGVMAGTALVV